MDRSLDEILAERRPRGGSRGGGSGRGALRRRGGGGGQDYPRDGIRKSFRDDSPRNLDSEWVHDRFDDRGPRAGSARRRRSPEADPRGTRVRVDNLHYELTEDDLEGLFSKIGPIQKLQLIYDRAGRSEGLAFVTYEAHQDAQRAIREFDGANAAGQPIRLTIVPTAPTNRRNPFDTAVMPGRSLADRITVPHGRSRSFSPGRRDDDDEDDRRGGDRYRPGNGTRSRSPLPPRRREGGRRSGARREGRGGGDGGRGGGERGGRHGRTRKTQEELDAEMADYFGADGNGAGAATATTATNGAAAAGGQTVEDTDMIE